MYYKFPSIPHFPTSPGVGREDSVLKDLSSFEGKKVVVSLKMDGENTTMYRDYVHARSIDSKDHPSRHWVKAFHSSMRGLIPEGWRVCGENLFARHSIAYENLSSFFLVFAIFDNHNICLPASDVVTWCAENCFEIVPSFYWGTLNMHRIMEVFKEYQAKHEGFVMRLEESFSYDSLPNSMVKWVRAGHVQTDDHWMFQKVIANKIGGRE